MNAHADLRRLSDGIARWREHPASMVRELFAVEPDEWQLEALEAFPKTQRLALVACKGPGKTTVLAWLCWNFLLTRPHPKIAATSITSDNLTDGLWTEMSKWQQKSELLKQTFTWTKTRIFSNDHPETWWMAARAWPRTGDKDQQADTLAGLHADYILFVLDETGGIPDAVMAAAEAALATGIECHIVQAGNPTMLEGPLWRAAKSERRLWYVINITGDPDNPKRSPRVSVQWAKEQIEKYGRESPWVLVNVFGEFPRSSLNALIGIDEVMASQKRFWRAHEIGNAARVLGVDVARFGDDSSVLLPRQGIQCYPLKKYRDLTSTAGAGIVARVWESQNLDGVFIDNTGGFGSGWIDQLNVMGKAPIGVGFADRAHEHGRFYNKRVEMYFDAVQWIKDGGALPESRELAEALTRTTYTIQGNRLLLEPKDDVKSKLGYSPDEADAFVLTFAEPVSPGRSAGPRTTSYMAKMDWNPFAEQNLDQAVRGSYDYDRR